MRVARMTPSRRSCLRSCTGFIAGFFFSWEFTQATYACSWCCKQKRKQNFASHCCLGSSCTTLTFHSTICLLRSQVQMGFILTPTWHWFTKQNQRSVWSSSVQPRTGRAGRTAGQDWEASAQLRRKLALNLPEAAVYLVQSNYCQSLTFIPSINSLIKC